MSKTSQVCETSSKSESSQLRNKEFLQDFLNFEFENVKNEQFCQISFENRKLLNISASNSGPRPSVFNTLASTCALRHNGVHFSNISASKVVRDRRFFPNFAWGSCFLILYPGSPPRLLSLSTSRTTSFTYNFVTHHLSHTTLSHTIFHTTLSHTIFHTQLCHTPSFTHNFVTHHLSHTTLSHTIFHIQLCQTLSFTNNFVTHHLPHLSHTTLSHIIFHIQLCHTLSFTHNFVTHHLSHTTLSHTIFHTHLCHTPSLTYNFVTHHHSHITSSVVLRGRRGTNSHLPSFGVAGVALMALGGALGLIWSPVTPRHFAWQAWHKLTPTVVLRGRRGTNSHLPSFCVAGVAQTHIYHRLAWQAWH